MKADVGNNMLKYFLFITRKLKSYDEQLGPYDALRSIVSEDGSYKLLSHGRALEESVVTPPFNASCILQTLSQLEPDEPWVVCPGIRGYSAYRENIGFDIKRVVTGNRDYSAYRESIGFDIKRVVIGNRGYSAYRESIGFDIKRVVTGNRGYSAYRESIGFDIKRVVTGNCPSDSVRDRECTILYKQQSTTKSLICTKCTSLKWLLTKRKKEHDGMPASQQIKRQSSSSNAPFNVLSPSSQQARVET